MAASLDQIFSGFNLSGIGTSILNNIFYVILLLIIGGAMAVFAIWYFKKPKYNIIAEVYAERYGSMKPYLTKACKMENKKAGMWEFKVKGFSRKWPLPDSKYFTPTVNGRDMIFLYYKNGEIFPVLPPAINESSLGNIQVIEGDIQFWSSATRRVSRQIFTSFKDKLLAYLPYAIFFATMVLLMVIIVIILNKFEVLRDVAGALNEASKNLQTCRAVTLPGNTP